MTKIQVSLRAVVRDENFPVLDRIHGARVNVDIRIKFLHGNGIPPGFQQTPERGGRYPLAETGYNTSGNKYILYCHNRCPPVIENIW